MSFLHIQQSFINKVRNPNARLPAGTDERHMAVYRELFFNNINHFIDSAFPVLKSLYQQEQWQVLVETFFAEHDCQSPIFCEISLEFLLFLQQNYQAKTYDPPFMLELAHYEWIELDVAKAMEDSTGRYIDDEHITDAKFDDYLFCLSSLARVVQYSFDVQNISANYQPDKPLAQPVFFCVYRDKHDEVQFLKLNPLAAQLLNLLDQNITLSWNEMSNWLESHLPHMNQIALQQGAKQLITQMAVKGVICQRE